MISGTYMVGDSRRGTDGLHPDGFHPAVVKETVRDTVVNETYMVGDSRRGTTRPTTVSGAICLRRSEGSSEHAEAYRHGPDGLAEAVGSGIRRARKCNAKVRARSYPALNRNLPTVCLDDLAGDG